MLLLSAPVVTRQFVKSFSFFQNRKYLWTPTNSSCQYTFYLPVLSLFFRIDKMFSRNFQPVLESQLAPKFTDSCLYRTHLAVNQSCVQFFVAFILRPVNCKNSWYLGLIYFGLICSKLLFSFCCLMVRFTLVLPHTHALPCWHQFAICVSLLADKWYCSVSV
jgi:hypothetical protein